MAAVQRVPLLPHQLEVMNAQERTVVSIGGVGSGKSLGCIYAYLREILEYPYCQPYVIGPTYGSMKEGTLFSLKAMLDELDIAYTENRSDLSITIDSDKPGGTRIIAWTAEAYRRLKGQALDIVWGDEAQVWERGQEVFDFIGTRMRQSETCRLHHPEHRPRIWMSANPPHSTAHWLYQYFVKKNAPDTRLIRTTTFDNYLLPQREEYIERMRSRMDPQLFAIEVLGEWGDLGIGRAYVQFDQKRHVSTMVGKLPAEYDPNRALILTNDFGVDPRVALIIQVHDVLQPGFQRQVAVILDEIRIRDGSTVALIEEFAARYPREKVSRLLLYGDPAGNSRNSTTGVSDWALMKSHPLMQKYDRVELHYATAAPLVKDRVNATNAKLRNAKDEIGTIVHPRCVHFIEDAQQTRWKDGTVQLDHGSPAKGILRTHLTDAFGYFVHREWPLVTSTSQILGQGWTQR